MKTSPKTVGVVFITKEKIAFFFVVLIKYLVVRSCIDTRLVQVVATLAMKFTVDREGFVVDFYDPLQNFRKGCFLE